MRATRELKTSKCQKTKDIVRNNIEDFVELVTKCLYNEDFVETMNALLPFDNFVQSKLQIEDDTSMVRSIGVSIMRMEFERPLFSLGINIEIAESKGNKAINSTILISACRTLEELREYTRTDDFIRHVKENFEKQIDSSFYK